MVNLTLLQTRIDHGNGIVASVLGEPVQLYRPVAGQTAIVPDTMIGLIQARFDPSADLSARKPNLYGHPAWIAAIDRTSTGTAVGDYLVAAAGTYFIVEQQALVPTACVLTNRTVSVYRPASAGTGSAFYFGNDANNGDGTLLLNAFPCSLLQGTKGERDPDNLPQSARQPWCAILLPVTPGVTIDPSDLIIDDLGHRWTVSNVEISALGSRITASFSGA